MPILLTKEEVVGKKAKVVLVHYELPFSFFFFLFKSCVDIFVVLPNIYLFITPPSVGSTSHRRQKSAARLINSTYPHSLCRSFIIIFFILQRKYTTKRGNITACVAFLPPTPVSPVSQPTQGDLTMNAVIFFFFFV